MKSVYLGDSVYCDYSEDGYYIIYLDNGEGPKNLIEFEPETMISFINFIKQTNPKLLTQ